MISHITSILAALDWMQWMLLVFLLFIAGILYRAQINNDNFDLRHLVADRESGKIDRFAFGYIVVLVLSSWVFLYFAMAGKLTEYYFWGYMLVGGAPKVLEKYFEAKKP